MEDGQMPLSTKLPLFVDNGMKNRVPSTKRHVFVDEKYNLNNDLRIFPYRVTPDLRWLDSRRDRRPDHPQQEQLRHIGGL